jgi:hypothetical protein
MPACGQHVRIFKRPLEAREPTGTGDCVVVEEGDGLAGGLPDAGVARAGKPSRPQVGDNSNRRIERVAEHVLEGLVVIDDDDNRRNDWNLAENGVHAGRRLPEPLDGGGADHHGGGAITRTGSLARGRHGPTVC